ncbi:MAG TPA: hypothetical protein DFS52_17485 [Myxococcales bacterium]|nr:hypothetical protein [Myxococcales bacterium]
MIVDARAASAATGERQHRLGELGMAPTLQQLGSGSCARSTNHRDRATANDACTQAIEALAKRIADEQIGPGGAMTGLVKSTGIGIEAQACPVRTGVRRTEKCARAAQRVDQNALPGGQARLA